MLFLTGLRGSISVPVAADHHINSTGPLNKQPGHHTHTNSLFTEIHDTRFLIQTTVPFKQYQMNRRFVACPSHPSFKQPVKVEL